MIDPSGTVHVKTEVDVKGYTLIIPSVSVGNVGQLSIDTLISTLNAKCVGFLWHPALLPVVGCDPYNLNSKSLMMSSGVYIADNLKLVFIQLRSPLLKEYENDFLQKIVSWIKNNFIEKVVILTGSYAYVRHDAQITGSPMRYLATDDLLKEMPTHLRTWKNYEKFSVPVTNGNGSDTIPGGGFAKLLFDICARNNIPSAVLLVYCSEGNNIPEALMLASYLNEWAKLISPDSQWVQPPSWEHMYGNGPAVEIY